MFRYVDLQQMKIRCAIGVNSCICTVEVYFVFKEENKFFLKLATLLNIWSCL